MLLDRRNFLAGSAALAFQPQLGANSIAVFEPEDYGAHGDGYTNDTAAFAALSVAVQQRGGGIISLRRGRTYVVGQQKRGDRMGWSPSPVLELSGLEAPLHIRGNGARLMCEAGLRFGTFDLNSGDRVDRPMPNLDRREVASPYRALVHIRECSGPVLVTDLELDGNLERLRIGGHYGDTGWQVPATGLLLEGNLGAETAINIHSHHHGQDGVIIIGNDQRKSRSRFTRLMSEYNGRQGLSLTGGRGYDFAGCKFSRSGRSSIASAPGAGVDIEAEQGTIRDVSFTHCQFIDNIGVGMVADSGDSADVRFVDCLFVGTTTWSAWPYKPRFRFERCTFAGSVVHAFASPDPNLATKFLHCKFTDDARLSPTGQLFLGGGPIVNLAESLNVLFQSCEFSLIAEGVLPWSWRATYRDCTMIQASRVTAMTKGKFLGRTVVEAPVDLYGSMIVGKVELNGNSLAAGPVGEIASW